MAEPSKFLLQQIEALKKAPYDLDLAHDIGVQATHEGFPGLGKVLMDGDVDYALAYLPWEPRVHIRSNYNWRNFVYRADVPQQVLDEFDYQDEDVFDGYFRYQGYWYHLDQFMEAPEGMFPGDWNGYLNDSMSTGVVIRVSDDGEQYQVGTFVS